LNLKLFLDVITQQFDTLSWGSNIEFSLPQKIISATKLSNLVPDSVKCILQIVPWFEFDERIKEQFWAEFAGLQFSEGVKIFVKGEKFEKIFKGINKKFNGFLNYILS
jgi:hypothetical protein